MPDHNPDHDRDRDRDRDHNPDSAAQMRHILAALETLTAQQQQLLEQQRQHYRQIEALFSLFARLPLQAPLPFMRGFAISPDFAVLLLRQLEQQRPRLVVELGSGVSSLISGYMLQQQGAGRVIALEQDGEYAGQVAALVQQHGLAAVVDVRHAPLTPVAAGGQPWPWYDPAALSDLHAIDLLVVDGPAQYANPQPQVRYPALPLLFDRLVPGAYVLVDDASRADEQQVVARWLAEYALHLIRDDSTTTEKGAKLLQKA